MPWDTFLLLKSPSRTIFAPTSTLSFFPCFYTSSLTICPWRPLRPLIRFITWWWTFWQSAPFELIASTFALTGSRTSTISTVSAQNKALYFHCRSVVLFLLWKVYHQNNSNFFEHCLWTDFLPQVWLQADHSDQSCHVGFSSAAAYSAVRSKSFILYFCQKRNELPWSMDDEIDVEDPVVLRLFLAVYYWSESFT